jgi:RHS repeat-associated protein
MASEYGSSRLFEVLWRWIRRSIIPVILLFLVSSVPFARAAQADPGVSLKTKRERSVDVTPVKPRAVTPSQSDEQQWSPEPVRWPAAGKASVSVARNGRTPVAGQPVKIGHGAKAVEAAAPAEVTSEVLSRAVSEAAGVSGPMLRLERADEVPTSAPVAVEIDYSSFGHAYGADWARRLRLVELPACAARTPQVAACQTAKPVPAKNDIKRSVLVADVAVAAPEASTGPDGTVLAVTAAAASADTGTFARSGLADSASWVGGMPSGDFTWSYDMEVPPAPGGLEPDVGLSYSSGAVDGRTNAENTQPSWIGEGWDHDPGYIERGFRACKDDVTGATPAQYTNATDDLCYRDQNAVLVLDGKSTELVLDDATGKWRLAEDDGSRIELVTAGTATGLHNNEHWKLTTTDGTQYWFGKTQLPGWAAGKPVTDSVWGVPVFANRTGEPCFKTGGFAGSNCSMAWRWNLDYVVDPHGNTMSYWYFKEKSNTKLAGTTTVRQYEKGGFLKRIEYGTRAGTELSAPAPMKVQFTEADRCLSNCFSGSTPVAANWPDTPLDLQCNAAPCNNNPTPTFFSSRRLSKIATFVRVGATDQPVDEWTLTHSFPATGETTVDPALWLASITHTGKAGGNTALPKAEFAGVRNANRTDYNTAAAVPQTNKWRLNKIITPSGGQINVTYEGSDCTVNSQADPDANSKRCFPQYYAPPDTTPGWSWWNKYRVRQVTEQDLVGGSPTVVHRYDYDTTGSNTTVLWHHNDTAKWGLTEPKRTWSDWRGWPTVKVVTGADGGVRTRTDYRYFRGMHADSTDAGETARAATITDSHNVSHPDHNDLAGHLLETISYDANHTTVLHKTRQQPWRSRTAERVEHPDHAQPRLTEAWFTDTAIEETYDFLAASNTWRETEVEYAFDTTYGQVVKETDRGVTTTGDDDVCTTTSYARNSAAWLIDFPAEELITNCAAAPGPDDILAGDQTFYDDSLDIGEPPTRGLATRTKEFDSYIGTYANWVRTSDINYDLHGRVTYENEPGGRYTITSYTPDTGGPVTTVEVYNSEDHLTTTSLNIRGDATTETDANGKVTTAQYDPLGRLLKVWLPGRSTTQTPNTEYLYAVNGTAGPSTVESRDLGPNGNQISTFDIYDGLDRPRQQQSTAPDGKRVITDTRYDSRDLPVTTSELYNNASAPTGTLVTFAEADVPSQTRTIHDAVERPTSEELFSRGTRKWATTTSYDGDRINTTPPAGATPTTVILDAHGRTTALRQYKGTTTSGDHDETTYEYDRLDRLTTVKDAAGVNDAARNTWSRSYDRRSRLIETTDPDTGTTKLEYDSANRLILTTDSRGEKIARTYDTLGRITSLRDDAPDGPLRASYTYDTLLAGLPTSATRHHNGHTYTTTVTGYTDLDDPTGVSVTIPDANPAYGAIAGTWTTGFGYKPDGSIATVEHPAAGGLPAETVTYTYGNSGYLSGTAGLDTYLSGVAYHWSGEVKQHHLGAAGKRVRLSNDIDEATGRLTKNQVHTEHAGALDTWDEQLTELYRHDPAGNVLAVNEVTETRNNAVVSQQCFQYDYLRRLTEAWTTTATACQAAATQDNTGPAPYWNSYTYDATGNRLTDTTHHAGGDTVRDYTTPAAGQARPHTLTKRATRGGGPTTDYTHDSAGNLATRTAPGLAETYTWDPEGLLAGLTINGAAHSYIYDANGQRLIADDPTAVTAYLGNTELRRNKTTGQVEGTRYYPNAVRTTAGGLTWTADDYDGTAQLAVDATTLTTVRRRTTPFGETRGAPPATWPDRKGFVGGTSDASGYTHLGARLYDPSTGRFISPDPLLDLGDPQQLHGYSYANNSPITYHDPDGLRPKATRFEGGGGGYGGYGSAPGGRMSGGRSTPKRAQPKPKARHSRAQVKSNRDSIWYTKRQSNQRRANTNKPQKGNQGKDGGKSKGGGKSKSKPTGKANTSGKGKSKSKDSKGKSTGKRKIDGAPPRKGPPKPPRDDTLPKETKDKRKKAEDKVSNILDQGTPNDDIGSVKDMVSGFGKGAESPAQPVVSRPQHPHVTRPGDDTADAGDIFSFFTAVTWTILRYWRKGR